MTVKAKGDYSQYEGMTDEELIPAGFNDLPEDEQSRRHIVYLRREHERYMAEWETLSPEERRRRRLAHFSD